MPSGKSPPRGGSRPVGVRWRAITLMISTEAVEDPDADVPVPDSPIARHSADPAQRARDAQARADFYQVASSV
jgi:hypothetical protein